LRGNSKAAIIALFRIMAAPLNALISRTLLYIARVVIASDGVLEWCRAAPAPFRDGGLSAPRR
jgi:hypothetical protein